jgi:hypothetical protein
MDKKRRGLIGNKYELMTPIEAFIERESDLTDKQLTDYFKWKNRGKFYCQVKEAATKYLKDKGYTHERIASIVYGDAGRHDQISYNLNNRYSEISEDVLENWKFWVSSKKYPISKHRSRQWIPKNEQEEKMANAKGFYVENFTTYILT